MLDERTDAERRNQSTEGLCRSVLCLVQPAKFREQQWKARRGPGIGLGTEDTTVEKEGWSSPLGIRDVPICWGF